MDGIYESLRRYGAKEGILAAWCITADGRKVLLHLAVGNKESEACWTEFLRDMSPSLLRFTYCVRGGFVRFVLSAQGPSRLKLESSLKLVRVADAEGFPTSSA